MIEQEEGPSGTASPDEPEIVVALPSRPEEEKGAIASLEGSHEHEQHEGAGKRHGEETIESSRQPESHHSCIIDMKSTGESVADDEKVCRICHLSSDQPITSDLIHLRCHCKDELGMSHCDINMIEQEEGSSGTASPDEPEIVVALPSRPEEEKGAIASSEGSHGHEQHEAAGKRHGEETIESSRQPESHHSCIIDIKSTGESVDDEEKVCRICHLSSDQPITSDLIHLGCHCKDELRMSHCDINMIEQEEGSSGTASPDEPEIVVALPSRPEEEKGAITSSEGSHEHEQHEGAGKRHGEEMTESSRQPESHHSCIIDIKSTGESVDDEEKVCRICHLSSDQSITSDLIHLGCHCKDELGMSHRDCADIWFMHRGNRQCEICGQTATNIRGNRSSGFMIQRNERRLVPSSTVSAVSLDNDVSLSCCWGQRFCNFLLTCTVLAFLLPWFFRLNFFG